MLRHSMCGLPAPFVGSKQVRNRSVRLQKRGNSLAELYLIAACDYPRRICAVPNCCACVSGRSCEERTPYHVLAQ
jgi:hypothetical protein